MYQWLYKETIETGIMVLLEDVPKYLKEGYVDTPDNYKPDAGGSDDLSNMTKKNLAIYALAQFDVVLDLVKTKKVLIVEIEALEAQAAADAEEE